jgi:tetratricopeptide (TPR) repeat protein
MDNNETKSEYNDSLAEKGYLPAVACRHFSEGRYSAAVDICQQVLDREPHLHSVGVILARSLFHAGEHDRAHRNFLQILKNDADNLMALKYLGDIMFQRGEEAAAMTYYRRVFEVDPYCTGLCCPIKQNEIVRTRQLTIKRPRETKRRKERAPLQEPAFITETIGDIYQDQGYFRLAGEVYRRLLANNENSRIANKLKEIDKRLSKKGSLNES